MRTEVRRVLRPGGCVLAVDFATPARERKGILARFHRHGHVALRDIVELLSEAGLGVVESGSVGVSDLQFAVATRPSPRDDDRQDRQTHVTRSLDPLPAPRWLLLAGGIALVAGHGIIFRAASSRMALLAVAGVLGVLLIAHVPFAGVVRALVRRRERH